MDEKIKNEAVNCMEDAKLFETIVEQDQKISALPNAERESFIVQNSHYRLSNKLVELEYYGAKHTYEPKNPQFGKINESFQSFTEEIDLTKVVVLVEGSIPTTSSNVEQDIHQNGERGFITHLAREKGIDVACLEPDRATEVRYLLEQFKSDQIEYYYYLRAIRDYFRPGRIQTGISFDDYSRQVLEQHKDMYKDIGEFSDFDFSLDIMKRIHEDITGKGFDQNSRLDIDPRRSDNVINKISKACSNFRDFYHVRTVERYLTEGYSIFVVNGEEHAVIQRPALEIVLTR